MTCKGCQKGWAVTGQFEDRSLLHESGVTYTVCHEAKLNVRVHIENACVALLISDPQFKPYYANRWLKSVVRQIQYVPLEEAKELLDSFGVYKHINELWAFDAAVSAAAGRALKEKDSVGTKP